MEDKAKSLLVVSAAFGLGTILVAMSKKGNNPPPPGTPAISVNPVRPAVNIQFQMIFSGWTPNSVLEVVMYPAANPDNFTGGNVTVDANGYFDTPAIATMPGAYTIQAGGQNGEQATLNFTVTGTNPPPDEDTVTISGKVTNPSNQPVAGAIVTVTDIATQSSINATTDAQGNYLFTIVPDPPSSVSPVGLTLNWAASKAGFLTSEGEFVCDLAQTIDITLTPEPPPVGPPFVYSNLNVSIWTDARLLSMRGALFTCTIRNSSNQIVTHEVKMMWRRTYNGQPEFGPAHAYSNPSSLTLNPGESYSFTCDGYNPITAGFDIIIAPAQYSAGLMYYFWLEDELGNKSGEVSII